jgi:hypothetical protein
VRDLVRGRRLAGNGDGWLGGEYGGVRGGQLDEYGNYSVFNLAKFSFSINLTKFS